MGLVNLVDYEFRIEVERVVRVFTGHSRLCGTPHLWIVVVNAVVCSLQEVHERIAFLLLGACAISHEKGVTVLVHVLFVRLAL